MIGFLQAMVSPDALAGGSNVPEIAVPGFASRRWCAMLAAVAMAVVFCQFLIMAFRRYDLYVAGAFDLGIYQQAVWLTGHGLPGFVTVRGLHFLGDHWTPILVMLSPLVHVFSTVKLLLVVQSAALVGGAIPLYRLTLRRTGSPAVALVLACSYLLHSSLWGMAAFDFHPDCLAVPFLLAAVDALDEDAQWPFLIWCVLALTCKEVTAPVVALLGVLAWVWKRWRLGWYVAVGAGCWLFVALKLLAVFAHSQSSSYWSLYGGTLGQIQYGPLALIRAVATRLSDGSSQWYLAKLLVPVVFLSLAAPEVLAVCAPAVLSNLLSGRPNMQFIGWQYDAAVLPLVYAAAAVGVARVLNTAPRGSLSRPRCMGMVAGLLAAGTLFGCQSHRARTLDQFLGDELWTAAAARRDDLLATIPRTASVTAPSRIVPHLADRREIYMFPNPVQPACYGTGPLALKQEFGKGFTLLDCSTFQARLAQCGLEYVVIQCDGSYAYPLWYRQYQEAAVDALTCPAYGIVGAQGSTILLRRGAPFAQGLRLMGVSPAMMQHPAQVRSRLLALWPPSSQRDLMDGKALQE